MFRGIAQFLQRFASVDELAKLRSFERRVGRQWRCAQGGRGHRADVRLTTGGDRGNAEIKPAIAQKLCWQLMARFVWRIWDK
jgi:hypothetical protein